MFGNDDYSDLELTDFRTLRRNNKPNFGELRKRHVPDDSDLEIPDFSQQDLQDEVEETSEVQDSRVPSSRR